MRLRFTPLAEHDGSISVRDDQGQERVSLVVRDVDWQCADASLRLRIFAVEPLDLPAPEASEPVAGALARILRTLAGTGALAALLNPSAAFGPARMALAEGVRLVAVADPADEACWEALLATAVPVYGLRGVAVVDVLSAHPASVLSALAYGVFLACDGLEPQSYDEDRSGMRWSTHEPVQATVLAKGGFEVQTTTGCVGAYQDQGFEAYVRLQLRGPTGVCLGQPRFIMPRQAAHG